MSLIPSVSRPFLELVVCVLKHAWAILTFRHRGAGLQLSLRQMQGLGAVAVALAMSTSVIVPDDNPGSSAAFVGLIVSGLFSLCYRFFGPIPAAGLIVLTCASEPVSLFLHLADLAWVDKPFTLWTMAALCVFFHRAPAVQPWAK